MSAKRMLPLILVLISCDSSVDCVIAFSPSTITTHNKKDVRRRSTRTPFVPDVGGTVVSSKASKTRLNASTPPSSPSEPDTDMSNVFEQNRRWKHRMLQQDEDYFQNMGASERETTAANPPTCMWIGCADASVPEPEELIGGDFGSVYVVRNVANLVVSTDLSVISAVRYAVEHLRVPNIVVCGHYGCDGIRALTPRPADGEALPFVENWLQNVRDVYVFRSIFRFLCVCGTGLGPARDADKLYTISINGSQFLL